MNERLQSVMRQATRLTRDGRLLDATRALQRALRGAAEPQAAPAPARQQPGTAPASPLVLEGCVFEAVAHPAPAAHEVPVGAAMGPSAEWPQAWSHPDCDGPAAPSTGRGEFTAGTHTAAGLTRACKLYTPPGAGGRQLPLVVMLHGCTQDPEDFAAGTGMNERAREQGFFVLYPAQSARANPQRCWNWFKHNHQQRGSGEPALLASMTLEVIRAHAIDPRRVYVAGLSAGGAMAAIVAAAYPEIFAAVGVHSGLAGSAASDVNEALALMRSGVAGPRRGAAAPTRDPVPTIAFHGDADRTVHPRNGEQVIAAALGGGVAGVDAGPRVEHGISLRGRRYTRSTHHGRLGDAMAEHWLVHGAGHAWSGGHPDGSYTDASGPDATREMLRFFFDHPHA